MARKHGCLPIHIATKLHVSVFVHIIQWCEKKKVTVHVSLSVIFKFLRLKYEEEEENLFF